jgi:hypothetical protein
VKPLTAPRVMEGVPATALEAGHARIIFRWSYDDPLFAAKGEGVARVASPDSVRLDFFADGGLGTGGAILIGDSLRTAAEDGRRYLPPVPLLWAALGVLRVTARDTVVRRQGDTLWVELGEEYRAVLVGRQVVELGRIGGGRWRDRVSNDSMQVLYRQYRTVRRRLTLTALRRIPEGPFDAAIWLP